MFPDPAGEGAGDGGVGPLDILPGPFKAHVEHRGAQGRPQGEAQKLVLPAQDQAVDAQQGPVLEGPLQGPVLPV